MLKRFAALAYLFPVVVLAQSPFTPGVKPFVAVDAPVVALEHVRVIDGTGAAPLEDQTIVIDHGRIEAVGSSGQVRFPTGARRLDLPDHTVIPGLVGMHEHLFYPSGGGVPIYIEHGMSFPAPVPGLAALPRRARPARWNPTPISISKR